VHHVRRTRLPGLIFETVSGNSADHDDRCLAAALTKPAKKIEPTDARHHEIKHEYVITLMSQNCESLVRVGAQRDVADLLQHQLGEQQVIRLVVDDEDSREDD